MEEKMGIAVLTDDVRSELSRLGRTDRIRKMKKGRTKDRARFLKEPFRFTKYLLGRERPGSLRCTKGEVEQYLRETHSDPERNKRSSTVHKERWGSSSKIRIRLQRTIIAGNYTSGKKKRLILGQLLIPWSKILRKLWALWRVIWKKGRGGNRKRVTFCLRRKTRNLGQFRAISLVNVEGKISLAVRANGLSNYIVKNKYINISIHPWIFKMSWAHQCFNSAHQAKCEFTVIWLDLANAYGSVPHKLIEVVKKTYHVQLHVEKTVRDYFGGIKIRFTVGDFTTSWQQLEKVIVTGCIISPILFVIGMNLMMTAAERETRRPRTKYRTYHR